MQHWYALTAIALWEKIAFFFPVDLVLTLEKSHEAPKWLLVVLLTLLINRVLGSQYNILYKVSFLLVTWILFLMIIFLL